MNSTSFLYILALFLFGLISSGAYAQDDMYFTPKKTAAEVKEVAPVLFEKAGPSCVTDGICTEGAMTCGRLAALQAKAAKG